MSSYILRRLAQAVPTFFGVTLLSFAVMAAAPGDPATLLSLASPGHAPGSAALAQLDLDQPVLRQYLTWLVGNDWALVDVDGDGRGDVPGTRKGLLRGDLGRSISHQRPVLGLIAERIGATLLLTVPALILGFGAGILLGLGAALRQGTWVDHGARLLAVLGHAVPGFWLGLLLIDVFGVRLGWLPTGGLRDVVRPAGFAPWDTLRHMVLPVTVLALGSGAAVTRFVRAEALDVLGRDYVRAARAKGLSGIRLQRRHVLRNALVPAATLVGLASGRLLAGAVIVEQVFSWPGLGRLALTAALARDYPLVLGTVVLGSLLYTFGVLVSDLLYARLDPRVTYA